MSDINEKYQQQILFDEPVENNKTSTTAQQQIIVSNDDYQQDHSDELATIDEVFEQTLIKQEKPNWLWRTLLSLFTVLIVLEGIDYFRVGFIESPITTAIVAAIVLIISVLAGSALFKELTGLRQLKKQLTIQQQARDILSATVDGVVIENAKVVALCEKINKNLPCDLGDQTANLWKKQLQEEHNASEILHYYSRTVLSQVDQKALDEIAKFSSESVILIALSPTALLDMLLMLWRNLRMINKVAALYGLKLSYWSRIKLIKQVFVNIAYAGASEIVADVGTDMLGADLLGKLSGRLAQGLGAGMLTARLGLQVLRYARPIPYHPALNQDTPKLAMIRKSVIKQVTTLVTNNK